MKMELGGLRKTVDPFYRGRASPSGVSAQLIEFIAHVRDGRILAKPHRPTTKSRGPVVRGLHTINAVLFLFNAVLWAMVAKQPALATVWLAVGLGEIYVIRKTDLLSD